MSPTLLALARDKFIRPSSLGAIAECPARPTLEATVIEADGDPSASDEAALGTVLHGLAERAVVEWINGMSWGDAIAFACNEATKLGVDSWSVTCLQRALEAVRDLIAHREIERENVMTELSLDMESLGFTQDGTADLVLLIPRKLVIVVDYKFGFIDQGDADEHDQTQAYAAAAEATFVTERVEVFLIQPRAEKAYRVTGAFFDAETLRKNRAWTAAVIRRARAANPELKPGYQQCLYCKALRRCPAVKEYIVNAQEALTIIGTPTDPDARGHLLSAAKLAEKWSEEVKGWGRQVLESGEKATGWKLGGSRTISTIDQPALAFKRLAAAGHEEAALQAISLSYSKLTDTAAEAVKELVVEKQTARALTVEKRKEVAA